MFASIFRFVLFALLFTVAVALVYIYALPAIDKFMRENIWISISIAAIFIAFILLFIGKLASQIYKYFKRDGIKDVTIQSASRISLSSKHIEALLERANHFCQIPHCFHKDNLQIHHIDHNKSNPKSSNLIICCPNHHKEADGKQLRQETLRAWARNCNAIDESGKKRNNLSPRQIEDSEFKYAN